MLTVMQLPFQPVLPKGPISQLLCVALVGTSKQASRRRLNLEVGTDHLITFTQHTRFHSLRKYIH